MNEQFSCHVMISNLNHGSQATSSRLARPRPNLLTLDTEFTVDLLYEMNLLSQNHTNSNCNISISSFGNCKTCHNLHHSHFYRSVITNRIYHTMIEDSSDNNLTCKSTNIIYLLSSNIIHYFQLLRYVNTYRDIEFV